MPPKLTYDVRNRTRAARRIRIDTDDAVEVDDRDFGSRLVETRAMTRGAEEE